MRIALVPLVVGGLLLGGCAAFSDDSASGGTGGTGGSGADGRVEVVAAFYPLQFVSERVGGDLVEVTDLTQPGAEPHDLELGIAQSATVQEADLVVYEKGLQAAVDAAVDQRTSDATIDAGAVAGLEPLDHDGHDDAAHDHGSDGSEEEGGSDLGDLDPHFWQDPLKLARVADAVADRLSTLDPDHATTYAANARALDDDLTALDRDYTSGLSRCRRDTVVVSHNAFGYLGRYGLFIEPISGLSPDAEPTAADLARLQALIRREGVTTVFGERLASPQLARTLARDAGVTTAVLDPIEGLTDQTADETYLTLMRQNLAALQKANGCP